jgi:hypothetical protein
MPWYAPIKIIERSPLGDCCTLLRPCRLLPFGDHISFLHVFLYDTGAYDYWMARETLAFRRKQISYRLTCTTGQALDTERGQDKMTVWERLAGDTGGRAIDNCLKNAKPSLARAYIR